MRPYPKTENLYTRDEETHKLNVGVFRDPSWKQISLWRLTEKIDGTNIRVILKLDGTVEVRGRSDNANTPKDLVAHIESFFDSRADVPLLFEDLGCDDTCVVTLYGEGYGAGIQKVGGSYSPEKQFRIFDVVTTSYIQVIDGEQVVPYPQGWWRGWDAVQLASAILNIPHVPDYGRGTIEDAIGIVKNATSWCSTSGILPIEGVVARTDPYLYDRRGNRVMFKLKRHDLP